MPDNPEPTLRHLAVETPLPTCLEAERYVLSCLLQDPGAYHDAIFGALRDERPFYKPEHKQLVRIFVEMTTVGQIMPERLPFSVFRQRLATAHQLDAVGGGEYLTSLYTAAPTTANLESHVRLVADAYVLRELIGLCDRFTRRAYRADEEVTAIVGDIQRELVEVTEMRADKRAQSLGVLVLNAINYMTAVANRDPSVLGAPTGFPDLDRCISGLRGGELLILAARPSIGKTTFAMNVAREVAGQGVPVAFFSLEMGAEQVAMRFVCSEARISIHDVRDGRIANTDWVRIMGDACQRLSQLPIYIDDQPGLSAIELRQKVRRLVNERQVRFVVVDYLQLMKASGGNRTTNREQEVAKLSNDLKAIAREFKVPVMILAQLNRQAEAGGGAPKLTHLRESGALEQDADVVMLLHRERSESADDGQAAEPDAPGGAQECQLIIAKNRNGPTRTVPLLFFRQFTRFESKSRVEQQYIPGQPVDAQAGF